MLTRNLVEDRQQRPGIDGKDGVDWIYLAQDTNKWQAVVNTGIYLPVTYTARQILPCCTG